jgi:hypothetical protein
MTQPKYVPVSEDEVVRPAQRLVAAGPWRPHRPAEHLASERVPTRGTGVPGPDQGYALLLADLLAPMLRLSAEEDREDVIKGAMSIALRRAARFGRAPVRADLELAFSLFGYLDDAPLDLVAYRRRRFFGVSHDDWRERELAESVSDEVLAMTAAQVRAKLDDWKEFFTSSV